jgi:hypothetical protein
MPDLGPAQKKPRAAVMARPGWTIARRRSGRVDQAGQNVNRTPILAMRGFWISRTLLYAATRASY